MGLRVAFLQCELSHLHNPPHLGPSLLVSELTRRGHDVRRYFVHVTRLEGMAPALQELEVDLVALDSIFPLDVVRRFKRRLGSCPTVVGGLNALTLFERAPLEFAIVGAARMAIGELSDLLARWKSGGSPSPSEKLAAIARVPNLFFRRGAVAAWPGSSEVPGGIADRSEDGAPFDLPFDLDASEVERPWRLEEELLPFTPPLSWEYRGPSGRHPHSDQHGVSLIPEWGCPYRTPMPLPPTCADDRTTLRPEAYTDRAWERVARTYLDDAAACSFCIFRYQPFDIGPTERTVELLMTQLRYLWGEGIRSFALQSENPFRVVRPFVEAAVKDGRLPQELRLRTMVSVLKAHPRQTEQTLHEIAARGVQVEVTQVGFESFSDRALQTFHKGVTSWENRKVAQQLARWHGAVEGRLRTIWGHGLILFDPWTTLEELAENLEAIEHDAPFLKSTIALDSKLYLYSPYAPVARLVRADGLLVETEGEFGLDFRYRHEEVVVFREIVAAGLAPLLEATGRAGTDARERRARMIEGRYRWFAAALAHTREAIASGRDPRSDWGQTLAQVLHELGADA